MADYKYSIFKTRWGWFGLVGGKRGLIRTCLPVCHKEDAKGQLLSGFFNAEPAKSPFSALETSIQDYYMGTAVNFSKVKVCLDGFSEFQANVLTALRTIKYGKTVSYCQMAQLAGNPKGARAIGGVMAKNPLPLIIPCHRVVRADGLAGQFSAAGGKETKIRMLELEKIRS